MESGENPERASHCERESVFKPLGNREGKAGDELSQDTYSVREALSAAKKRGSVTLWSETDFFVYYYKFNIVRNVCKMANLFIWI